MYCVGKASSDRLYRAALLRNHFADTILKARENELEKGDKRDPEKVRMDRENLKDSKEKTKAPEDARRKAKAEVATTMMDGGEGWQRRWNRRRRATNGDECFSLL
uniref:Bromodomain-containing protein n=1 Tax=Cucumis melo TaxID=3656 RepID=A0A9I9EB27_CUCME